MSIHYTNGYPSKRQIQSAIRHYNDYGAIMMFDLRDHDVSETMNYFALIYGNTELSVGLALYILKTINIMY